MPDSLSRFVDVRFWDEGDEYGVLAADAKTEAEARTALRRGSYMDDTELARLAYRGIQVVPWPADEGQKGRRRRVHIFADLIR